MTVLRRFGSCTSGTAAVEFALIGLIVIALLLGIFEFGCALFMRNQFDFAADMAMRQILINPATPFSELESLIRDAVTLDDQELQVTLSRHVDDGIAFMTISIQKPLLLVVPGLQDGQIMLEVQREVPLQ